MTTLREVWRDAPIENDFTRQFGPLLRRRDGEGWVHALRVDARHRNGAGVMHGGALTAFVDEVAGTIVADRTGKPHVTVQFSTTFLHAVQVGDLVEMHCDIVKVTRSMAFAEARLTVAGEIVAKASLIFKARNAVDARRD